MDSNSFKVFIIFPVHLFKNIEIFSHYDQIYILEEQTYFTKLNFHKLKLMYHRATMKSYYDYLTRSDIPVIYKEYKQDLTSLVKEIKKLATSVTIGCYDPVDHALTKLLTEVCVAEKIKLEVYENLQFTCTNSDLSQYIAEHTSHGVKKKYTHDNSFYRWQRRRLNILMEKDGKDPKRWTYDTENRKPFHPSTKMQVPVLPKVIDLPYIKEAREYVEKNFPENLGQTTHFIYPIDFESAETWLDRFLKVKLTNYGPYQDAVHHDYPFMFHAILSPMMNIGLLPAKFIVKKTLEFYKNYPKTPIQSVEGFLRQVIGWREYVRLLYVFEGEKMRKCNFFDHHNKLNQNFYGKGGLGIHFMDDLIKKLDRYAYLHHIERLMYAGNFMLLCGMHPDEAYKWFMEYFIDSYDWVMVPNTYGMSMHASVVKQYWKSGS